MKTIHRVIYADASNMDAVSSESVDLMVTSPPYPMIEMWDEMFARQDASVKLALADGNGTDAFELMHRVLDPVWKEVYRVLKSGGFACINIGDATRTLNGNFALYPNHMRILKNALEIGFSALPCILWRKQTNAPNKFMGSGMLPAGAYVTLEHEYLLVLRKGSKREFKKEADKKIRRESAVFWEERNSWFSDVWFDVKGAQQAINDKDARLRSAAYPFEVAYRLINMYSAKGDTILDPFLGTGTTTAAAMASGRNSIGYEIDSTLVNIIDRIKDVIIDSSKALIRKRLAKHMAFVVDRLKTKGEFKYGNEHYGFPVMTAQERELIFNDPMRITAPEKNTFAVEYAKRPQPEFCKDWPAELLKHKTDVVDSGRQDDASEKDPAREALF
ncbi:DNA-methyltransferase [Thermodesulfobacteriota bacterium]